VDIDDMMLLKFVLAESRLSEEEVLLWLDTYEKFLEERLTRFQFRYNLAMYGDSLHQKLVYEVIVTNYLEQRRWIGLAQQLVLNKALGIADTYSQFRESEAKYIALIRS
jgi:hypothetical protein